MHKNIQSKESSKTPEKKVSSSKAIDRRFSVAPMLDWTDKHCRYFYRVMSKKTVLYTEMVTTGAILHGKGDYLAYNEQEHPLVLQLGGSNVQDMAECAKIAEQYNYDEININVGCPSDRVQNGKFGACLMAEPELVAECVTSMRNATSIPITVKSRIGIDEQDSYQFLQRFVNIVSEAGCQHFIIHARKAWLKGLSPKQNREIPELNYPRVYQIKQEFPELTISINGGIKDFTDVNQHLEYVDGVMVGREIYQNPYMLAQADKCIWQTSTNIKSRTDIIDEMTDYIEQHVSQGGRAWHVVRHMLGLCNGLAGAKQFRRYLSEHAHNTDRGGEVLQQAFARVQQLNPEL